MTDFETQYDRYYNAVLDLFSRTGSVRDVFLYIDSIQGNEGDYRDHTLGRFATFLASKNNASDAERFCSAISDPLERADALFTVAGELRRQGLIEPAKEFLNKSIDSAEAVGSYETAMVFLQIAGVLERLEEERQASELLHRAIQLAKPEPQDFEAGKTLRGCARLLASWNRVPEAIEIANIIQLPELRATALEEVQGRGQWPVFPGVRLDQT
jgi:hypothetical protein